MTHLTGLIIVLGMLIAAAVATIYIQEWSKVEQARAKASETIAKANKPKSLVEMIGGNSVIDKEKEQNIEGNN